MTLQLLAEQLIQFLLNFLTEILIILSTFLIPKITKYFTKKFMDFKLSQPELIQSLLEYGADLVIRSVEQDWEDGKIAREEKLNVALQRFNDLMKSFGYKNIDDGVLRTFLEGLLLPTKNVIAEEKIAKSVNKG